MKGAVPWTVDCGAGLVVWVGVYILAKLLSCLG
jgi:hypothetical protein